MKTNHIWPEKEILLDLACPVCGETFAMPKIIEIEGKTPWHKCPECGCLVPATAQNTSKNEEYYGAYSWRLYAEVAAGLEFITAPLHCLPDFGRPISMLDVGCGFGFAMLYAKTMFGAECTGFEPGSYGKMGRKVLGLDIRDAYFEGSDKKYDIVYSSEVLEHVPDPGKFVSDCCQALSCDGILILTTPAAEVVDKNNEACGWVDLTLQPNHLHIQSDLSLRKLLEPYEFMHLEIMHFCDRLIVFASRKHQINTSLFNDMFRFDFFLDRAIKYFDKQEYIKSFFLFRRLKAGMNSGNLTVAGKSIKDYENFLEKKYETGTILDKLKSAFKSNAGIETLFTIAPLNYPIYLFYKGVYEYKINDYERSAELLKNACELLRLFALYFKGFILEYGDCLWRALSAKAEAHKMLMFKSYLEILVKDAVIPRPPETLVRETMREIKENHFA